LNLARIVREEAARAEVLLQDRGRDLALQAPDALQVRGEARPLRDMIGALLENALTHGAGRVSVTLRGASDGAVAILEVADEGTGVPPADWTSVFERFHKREAASPGAGLGLAIVREVAEALGGDAGFVAPTMVRVRLPLAAGGSI